VFRQQSLRGFGLERGPTRHHLVHHTTQRVHVAPAIDVGVTKSLLWTHVCRCPDRDPCPGEPSTTRHTHRSCNAEVGHHGPATGEHYVFRFYVAVYDTLLVRIADSCCDLIRQAHHLANRNLAIAV